MLRVHLFHRVLRLFLLTVLLPTALLSLVQGASVYAAGDSWQPTTTQGAPGARWNHTGIWTGSEMIVWGGEETVGDGTVNTGGRYNPATDSWRPTSTINAPPSRRIHSALWTGSEMLVWGGVPANGQLPVNTGGRYNPATDTWAPITTVNAPTGRALHTAVWTGSEMIIWGGSTNLDSPQPVNTGARYNPVTDTWTPISTVGAPSPRLYAVGVWTGSEMIVWGGGNSWLDPSVQYTSGARYNPVTDTWTPISAVNAPNAALTVSRVWTGSEMIVWGGQMPDGSFASTGGRYNPGTDTWTPTATVNAPTGRLAHTGIWTGSEMIVWGGYNGSWLNTGGRYNPATDSWAAILTTGAPTGRDAHAAVWTGTQMIVWGGASFANGTALYNTGGRYTPGTSTSDTTKPIITPHVSGTLGTNNWYTSNVSVTFTCADEPGGSGLATPPTGYGDTTLSNDGPNQSVTSTGTCKDNAGNTADAVTVSGINTDKTKPTLAPIVTPNPVVLNGTATASANATDPSPGSGLASSSCATVVTTSIGAQSATCTAKDNAGNTNSAAANYSVTYKVCLLYDPTKAVKSGATIPLKVQLCDANGTNLSSSAITLHATGVGQVDSTASGTVQDAGNANPDSDFRYDATLSGYIFNLKTTGLTTGTWQVNFTVTGDTVVHSIQFDVQ